jgi:anti-anti-sigma regulatory factor
MDSSGSAMILGRYKVMARRGGSVSVRCANKQIDRVFELAGLYTIVRNLRERRTKMSIVNEKRGISSRVRRMKRLRGW